MHQWKHTAVVILISFHIFYILKDVVWTVFLLSHMSAPPERVENEVMSGDHCVFFFIFSATKNGSNKRCPFFSPSPGWLRFCRGILENWVNMGTKHDMYRWRTYDCASKHIMYISFSFTHGLNKTAILKNDLEKFVEFFHKMLNWVGMLV